MEHDQRYRKSLSFIPDKGFISFGYVAPSIKIRYAMNANEKDCPIKNNILLPS
jgi:hypothetical protein